MLKPDGVDKAVLTFRAQDAEGNAVSGLAVNASFTVPDGMAILLSDTFTETETKGTYTAELKGSTPGEVSVMPQVDGKDAAKASVTVVLSDVEPVAEHSTIALSSAATRADQAGQSFRAGEQVFVTVMLKDAQQHPVSGQKALLQGETVSVEGMSAADGADWQEEDGGAYRRVYIAQGAKEGHRATLTLTGGSKTTDPYTIEPGDVNISNSTLSGNLMFKDDGVTMINDNWNKLFAAAVDGVKYSSIKGLPKPKEDVWLFLGQMVYRQANLADIGLTKEVKNENGEMVKEVLDTPDGMISVHGHTSAIGKESYVTLDGMGGKIGSDLIFDRNVHVATTLSGQNNSFHP